MLLVETKLFVRYTRREGLFQDRERLYNKMARDLYGLGFVLVKKYKPFSIVYNIFMMGLVLTVLSFVIVFIQISAWLIFV